MNSKHKPYLLDRNINVIIFVNIEIIHDLLCVYTAWSEDRGFERGYRVVKKDEKFVNFPFRKAT